MNECPSLDDLSNRRNRFRWLGHLKKITPNIIPKMIKDYNVVGRRKRKSRVQCMVGVR